MSTSGGRRGKRRGRTPMADINVTPLVDVMLVLLIIFMVTAPLLKAGVPVELPDTRAKALSEETDQINISISREGAIYLEDSEVAAGQLAERLAALPPAANGKPPLVTLYADRGLDYGRVLAVMGELNRAGFNSISMVSNATSAEPAVSGGSAAGSDSQ